MDGEHQHTYREQPCGIFGGRILLASFVIHFAGAGVVLAQSTLTREIRSALTAVPGGTSYGVCVIDLTSGADVFSHNADTPLIPASNMKVFAMAAALTMLGPNFEFVTRFATDGRDLFLIGDGDPAFGDRKLCKRRGEAITAAFDRWAEALRESGLPEVVGDIIIDESIFGDRYTHPTWDEADLDNWYAAPVGGLNFNDNCVDISVSPAARLNAPARVSVQPNIPLIKIVNKCLTGGKGNPVLHHLHDSFEYKISKRCNKEWRFGSVSFPNPGLLAGETLRMVLIESGIAVAGMVKKKRVRGADGSLPDALKLVGQHRTPIRDVLGRAGKDSQNLFAECLLKRAGYAWARQAGTAIPHGGWEQGREAVLHTLRHANVDITNLQVADGSGLSRANRCTSRQLAETLAWIHGQPTAELLYDSLSIAGVDGSLRKRLVDTGGRVRGKTGTMRGIRTLSGYVDFQGVPRYSFSVMFNGYKGSSTPYKEIQDRICRAILSELQPAVGTN